MHYIFVLPLSKVVGTSVFQEIREVVELGNKLFEICLAVI